MNSSHTNSNCNHYEYFDVQNANGDTAHVLLYDKIGVSGEGDGNREQESSGISGRRFAEELYALSEHYRQINVRINSSGGKVIDGLSICSAILNINKSLKGVRVDTYVDGLALSIAGLIAVCGKKVYMSNFGQLMVHNPFIGKTDQGKGRDKTPANPMQHQTLHQIKEMLLTLLATRTGLATETLSGMMNQTTWLNAEAAKRQGFVDEIFDHPKKKAMTASLIEAGNDEVALLEVFNAYSVDTPLPPPSTTQINAPSTSTQTQNQNNSMTQMTLSAEEAERLRNEVSTFQGDLTAITNACGLSSDAGRDGIISHINAQAAKIKELTPLELSIDNFKTNIETLKNEKQKLAEQVAEMKRHEADYLIEAAIKEGKIAPAKKEKWLNHAYDNYEMVRDTLADMPVHPALASKIKAMGFGEEGSVGGTGAGFEQLTFSELSNQYPEKLELIKNENPALYKTLFRQEYGVDPSI